MPETNGKRCCHVADCKPSLMFALRSSTGLWAATYCEGDFERCARYRLAASRRPVPENLLPNGRELDPVLI